MCMGAIKHLGWLAKKSSHRPLYIMSSKSHVCKINMCAIKINQNAMSVVTSVPAKPETFSVEDF